MSEILGSTAIKAFVVTSDPQYPWTAKTDDGISESESARKAASQALIIQQYMDINDYAANLPSTTPVIINGDVTAFGHAWQWEEMKKLMVRLRSPYYYSMGNHDIENNLDDTFRNNAVFESLYDLKGHLLSKVNSINSIENVNLMQSRVGANRYHAEGNLNYSFNYDNIHFIQLNNDPTWSFYADQGALQGIWNYTKGLDWLEDDLKRASEYGQVIIVSVHKPNGWKKASESDITAFKNMLAKYGVTAVFAGHYHKLCGLRTDYKKFFGDIPVFLSGSSSQRKYLIAEYNNEKIDVFAVENNNHHAKRKVSTLDIKGKATGYSKNLALYEHVYGKGEDYIATKAPHARWNDQVSSVRLPPQSTISLYEHSNYTGDALVINNYSTFPQMYNLDFRGFNDKMSSYRMTTLDEKNVGLFEHINGGGENYIRTGAPHSHWNDKISSVYLPPKRSITLYDNSDFSGQVMTLRNDHRSQGRLYNLTDYGFNDKTSAYRIYTLNENALGLFKEHNGGGENFIETKAAHSVWNDKIRSVMLQPKQGIILYEHSDFSGRTLTLRNMSSTQGKLINMFEFGFANIVSAYRPFTVNNNTFGLFEMAGGNGENFIETGAAFSRWNDNISSILLPAKMTITLYEHIHRGGKSLTLNNWGSEGRLFDLGSYYFDGIVSDYIVTKL